MSSLALLSLAALACIAGFLVVFVVAKRLNNFSVVDIAWSYAFGALAVFYALGGAGWPVRRALFAAIVAASSLRLGTHLARRILRHHPQEDARYAQLRTDWAANFVPKMLGFFLLQGFSVALLGLGFVFVAQNTAPGFGLLEFAGLALWLGAFAGEAIADAQLAAFQRDPVRRSGVCDTGLWRYSRHPNYFFEWLTWVAYFVFALGSPLGWTAVVGPACMLWLLLRVTGVPLTEAQSLRSRGDAYRRYQQRTSAFVPWFPAGPDSPHHDRSSP